jgi:hypothetical protein
MVVTPERNCQLEKACKQCGLVKPHSDFYACKNRLDGLRAECKSCIKRLSSAAYFSNKDRRAITVKAWRVANRDKVAELARARTRLNPEMGRAATKRWRAKNREQHRVYRRKYRHINPASVVASELRRKRALEQACVKWADQKAISAIYRKSRALSKKTGSKFEVDHIVPLRHTLVCGLHVEANLEIVPLTVNRRKSNSFWPDMPDQSPICP